MGLHYAIVAVLIADEIVEGSLLLIACRGNSGG
jgi:hypothetical protein